MVGAKDRDTNFVSAAVVEHTNQETLQGFVTDHSNEDATVYTDDHKGYRGLPRAHKTVKHSTEQSISFVALPFLHVPTMPGVNHGKVLWRRFRATRPRPIEHDRPYALTVARKQGDLGDDSSRGPGTVAPPAVRT